MSLKPILKFIKKPVIAGLLVFISCLGISIFVTYQRYLIFKNIQQRELTSAANAVKDKIEANLKQGAEAASTFSFIVKNYGVGNNFDSIASEILRSHKDVDIIQLVKGGIITHVYPFKGNEASIGFDILADPTVSKGILQAVEKKEMFYGGPFKLVVGGSGIVIDLPIFIDNKFWGFSTVIIKLSTLIHSAHLENENNSEYSFQLSRVRPRTNQEEFYLPGADKFKKELSVDVGITEGKWKVYASFNKAQTFFSPIPFLIVGLLLSIAAGFFIWDKTRQPQKLKKLVDEQTGLLNHAFASSAIGMALVSLEGNWMRVNKELCRMLGYSQEELLAIPFSKLTHPDDIKENLAFLVDAGKGKAETYRAEKRYFHRDGSIVWANLNSGVVKDDRGQPLHFVAQIEDITEKKKAEKKLLESKVRFREVLENSLSASYKRNLRTNSYEYLSPVFKKIAGYTQEEMNTMPLEEVIGMMHPADIQIVTDNITRAISEPNKLEHSLEYRFKHKITGEYRWLQDDFVVMYDDEGQAVSFIGSVSDITERKQIETELSESKEQMTLFVEHSPASLAMFDNEMRYIATSRRWMVDYNLRDQNIIGKTHYEVFPEVGQEWKDIHQRCLAGAIERRDEDSFTRLDGTMDWLKWEIRPWHKASGEIGGIIMFTEVITEQKESELKFKNLVEKSLVGVYMIQKGKFVYVNPKFAQILGYTQEELLRLENSRQLVYENHNSNELIQWRKKVDAGIIDDFHLELQHQRKDGAIIWAELYCGETLYKGTKAILGTFQDITERKNAEAVIKEQAETFSAIIENANESIWLLSPDLKVLQFNKTAKERLELNRGKEIYLGANFKEFLHIGTENVFMPMFNEALAGNYIEKESTQTNVYGKQFWLRTKMYPVYNTQKQLIGVTVLTENITDRKKAEIELEQSEERHKALVENIGDGIVLVNQSRDVIYQSPSVHRINGYSFEERDGRSAEELIYHEDLPAYRDFLQQAYDNPGVPMQGQFRMINKEGQVIWLEGSMINMLNNESVKAIVINYRDVTEKHLYEQKLMKAAIKAQEEERYEIGGELHDNVCQLLATSLMFLGMMKKHLPGESIEIFDETNEYIGQAADEIRNLSHRLAPVFFDEETLEEALTKLLRTFNAESKYIITLKVDYMIKRYSLNRDMQLNLYRILQEQLRNIMKHAKATQINIRITMRDFSFLQMSIVDNGIGFDASAAKGGIGLANMKRRAQLFSGTFSISSTIGKGCGVLVEFPLSGRALIT
jgi:PAS domain S-box-containing protein